MCWVLPVPIMRCKQEDTAKCSCGASLPYLFTSDYQSERHIKTNYKQMPSRGGPHCFREIAVHFKKSLEWPPARRFLQGKGHVSIDSVSTILSLPVAEKTWAISILDVRLKRNSHLLFVHCDVFTCLPPVLHTTSPGLDIQEWSWVTG